MLRFFRKNTKTIVWVVVIAFVAWGGYAVSVQFEASNRAPGRVFGKEISYRDYLSAFQGVQIFTPKTEDGTPPDQDKLEARTWQFLILLEEAKHRKIQVKDEEVREEITRLLAENKELLFTPEQYGRWVQAVFHEQPTEFEAQLRDRLRVQKLLDQVKKELGAEGEKKLQNWMFELIGKAKIEIYKGPSRSL